MKYAQKYVRRARKLPSCRKRHIDHTAPMKNPAQIAESPCQKPRYPAISTISFPSPAPIRRNRNKKYTGTSIIPAAGRNPAPTRQIPAIIPSKSHRFRTFPQRRSVQAAPARTTQSMILSQLQETSVLTNSNPVPFHHLISTQKRHCQITVTNHF